MAKSGFQAASDKFIAAAERGMQKAVLQLEADTKMLTHVDTGALRRSWTHDVRNKGDDIIGVVGSNLEYAPYEDEYHGNLSTAMEENHDKYYNTIYREIKRG